METARRIEDPPTGYDTSPDIKLSIETSADSRPPKCRPLPAESALNVCWPSLADAGRVGAPGAADGSMFASITCRHCEADHVTVQSALSS